MRILVLAISALLAGSCCSAIPLPYTATFDDVTTGQNLTYYYQHYGLDMIHGWEVVDAVASGWGTPYSGSHAVVWNGNPQFGSGFDFGIDGSYEYTVRSVGAYFSTQPGVVMTLVGYRKNFTVASSVSIGGTGETWTNRYAEISSAAGDIALVRIVSVSPSDARYRFSMDDLTITPIPEPSPLLALLAGLSVFGAMLRRRRG